MISNNEQGVSGNAQEIERIRTRIEKLVVERFNRGEDLYYLAQLGIDLGDDRKSLERLSGMKLAEFIESKFQFQFGRTGAHENVLYIQRPGIGKVEPPSAAPRYKRSFWAAFAAAHEGNGPRFINLLTLKFGSDKEGVATGDGDVRPIDRKYLTVGQYASPAEVLGRIREWLTDQELEQAPFIIRERRTNSDDRESLLDALLNTLSGDQLKRVSLPLDVVRALSDRRIG